MSDSKTKAAELEAEDFLQMKVVSKPTIPTMKYHKDKNWERVRQNILGMMNAYEPTVIDNTDEVKENCIRVIEDELRDAQALYDDMKESGLTANSIECEGYIRACNTILNKIEEWV